MKEHKPTKEARALVKVLLKSGTVTKEQASQIEKMLVEGREDEAAEILSRALGGKSV